jgi:DNA repair exonuclease SbcCD nuclease subunit
MRLLYFTDTHIRRTAPSNRKDNYINALKNKLSEIVEISINEHIDYVLHGGDWFDRPDIDDNTVNEFAAIVKGFNSPVYTIAGNHDVFEDRPESIVGTRLGNLIDNGIVRLVKNDKSVMLKEKEITIQLTGRSYSCNLDGENYKDYYVIKKYEKADYAIHMIHGMLLSKPFPVKMNFTLVKDIAETAADITLAGHYHSGFGIICQNDKFFINPGSIVRITNYKSELVRRPKIVILDIGSQITVKEIELSSALPGREVLYEDMLKEG